MAREWRVVAVAVAVAIVVGSLVPGSAGTGGGFPSGADKLLHAAGYAVLSFCVAATLRARTVRTLAAVVVAVAALGAGVELVQPAVDRNASPLDAAANLTGAIAGVAIWRLVTRSTADTLAD